MCVSVLQIEYYLYFICFSDNKRLYKMPPKTRKTVNTSLSDYIGTGKEMLETEVPTLRAALRKALLIREERVTLNETYSKQINMGEVMDNVVEDVIRLWQRSNVKFVPPVIIQPHSIRMRLLTAWDKFCDISRKRITKKKTIEMWENKLDKLIDITTCQYVIEPCTKSQCTSTCTGYHAHCKCVLDQKLPVLELEWIYHQRQKNGEVSCMMMSSDDKIESERQTKAYKRKYEEEQKELRRKKENKKKKKLS